MRSSQGARREEKLLPVFKPVILTAAEVAEVAFHPSPALHLHPFCTTKSFVPLEAETEADGYMEPR